MCRAPYAIHTLRFRRLKAALQRRHSAAVALATHVGGTRRASNDAVTCLVWFGLVVVGQWLPRNERGARATLSRSHSTHHTKVLCIGRRGGFGIAAVRWRHAGRWVRRPRCNHERQLVAQLLVRYVVAWRPSWWLVDTRRGTTVLVTTTTIATSAIVIVAIKRVTSRFVAMVLVMILVV